LPNSSCTASKEHDIPVPASEEVEHETESAGRTRQEVQNETQKATTMDAIVSAIQRSLPAHVNVDIKKDLTCESQRILLSVDLQNCTRSASKPYDITQIVRQALQCGVAGTGSSALLSARVQKEETGYSLRSSVACFPVCKRNSICWDFLQKGSCPRRNTCRWHHPSSTDIVKFKIVIRNREACANSRDISLQPRQSDTRFP
jgi:hypothetical protein